MSMLAAPRLAGLFVCALLWLPAFGQDLVPVPPFTAHAVDMTGASLSLDQLAQLEAKLTAFEARKGSQVAVLIVPTTQPETIEQYSIRVVDQWKVGRRRVDDGVLLLIAKNDRALRIEVGYGLEGVLPDAIAKRIVDDVITPQFRAGNFHSGIDAGVDAIIKVIDGEALPPPEQHWRPSDRGTGGSLHTLFIIGFVLLVVIGGALRAALGRLPAAVVIGGLAGIIIWVVVSSLIAAAVAGVIAFVFTLLGGASMLGGSRTGGWGGGGFGGGGGGGFGGGGGGGFGGGGASGRW